MAEIKVSAVLDAKTFKEDVSNLQTKIDAISNKTIKIKIELEKGGRATENMIALARAQAEAEAAAARHAAAEARLAEANAKVAASANRLQVEQEKTKQQHEKTLQAIEKTAQGAQQATKSIVDGAAEGTQAVNKLEVSIHKVGTAFTGWLKRQIWYELKRELRETMNAMKEMDSQLTTIKRVAGISDKEAAQYQQQAFEMGSKYGMKPEDYLANVVEFTRAGYQNLAPALGELATKMQLVGEVSQETAAQMLLSTDAAYHYAGDVQKLGAVLDGVTVIGDKNATSMEKIAAGMGLVAPVAAQANVGVDELAAALGTVTAVTQRSGSEAARGLRALFLNIMGDTKTEIEDGATWTADEIKGLHDLIMKYAGDEAIEAAVEGNILNPMKAIEALSKAVKDGTLSEVELAQQVTDIGGKLRASQLLALINNFDMYTEMVNQFREATGAADAKIEVAMTGWEQKANQLTVAFQKLFTDVLQGDTIKGGIDTLRGFVQLLDIGEGIPARIVATATAVMVLGSAIARLKDSAALQTLKVTLSDPRLLALAAAVAAVTTISELANYASKAQERREEQAQESADAYKQEKSNLESITEELKKQEAAYDALKGKANRTAEEEATLAVLEKQTEELRIQQQIAQYKTEQAFKDAAASAAAAGMGASREVGSQSAVEALVNGGGFAPGKAYAKNINTVIAAYLMVGDEIERLNQERTSQVEAELIATEEEIGWLRGVQEEYGKIIAEFSETESKNYETAKEYYDAYQLGEKTYSMLTSQEKQIVDFVTQYSGFFSYINSVLGISTGAPSGEAAGSTAGAAAPAQELSEYQRALDKQAKQFQAINAAIKDYNETGMITKGVYEALTAAGIDLADSTLEADDGYVIAKETLEGLIKSCKEWYDKYGLQMPGAFTDISDSARDAAGGLQNAIEAAGSMAKEANAAGDALDKLKSKLKETGEVGDDFTAYQSEYKKAMALYEKGMIGSREFQGFAQMLLGPEVMASLNYDFAKAGELLSKPFYQALFGGGGDDYGKGALEWLVANIGTSGGDAYSFFTDKEGNLNAVINDFDALAKRLGISKDALFTLTDAWGIWSGELNTTDRKMISMLDEMNEGVTTLANGTKQVDLSQFIKNLAMDGKTAAEINQYVNRLLKTAGVNVDQSGVGEGGLTKAIQDAVKEANTIPITVTTEGTEEAKQEVQSVKEEASSTPANIRVDADISEANDAISALYEEKEPATIPAEVEVETDLSGVLGDWVNEEEPVTIPAEVEVETDLSGVLDDFFDEIDQAGEGTPQIKIPAAIELDAPSDEELSAVISKAKEIGMLDERGHVFIDTDTLESNADEVNAIADELVAFGFLDVEARANLDSSDAEDKEQAIADLRYSLLLFERAYTAYAVLNDENATSAEKEAALTELKGILEEVNGDYSAEVKAEVDGQSETKTSGFISLLQEVKAGADATITATDSGASATASAVKETLDAIPENVTSTITVKTIGTGSAVHTTSTGGTAGGGVGPGFGTITGGDPLGLFGPKGNAAGTRNYPGGKSLVNEKGPELISANGRAFIANGGAPTIVDLPRGSVIFNAEETRHIVSGNGVPPEGIYGNADGTEGTGSPPEGYYASLLKKKKKKSGGGGGGGGAADNTDYWAIIEAHYNDITTTADNAIDNLKYQIDLLKNAWDDEKEPLDDQIDALKELNELIDRQITLLERERDKMTEPIQDEIDALNAAKDIQDEQLELAERQKAVEEARAELQNAQNERTIRFFNKETGHWEWMADQERIRKAQESLESAQKSLSDYEYDLHIKELERQVEQIEADYQGKIDKLEADNTANEDTIYDLNQRLKEIEREYEAIIKPLEDEQEDRQRSLEAAENAWNNILYERREKPEGDLATAIKKEGATGAAAGTTISELKADLDVIAKAYTESQKNNTLASLGILFGATPTNSTTGATTTIAGNVTDSHNIIINGITMPASAAYQSLMDIANDLKIYAGE